MYKQNIRFSQMKDKKIGMKNSSKINKTGVNVSGRYRNANNRGRINRSFGKQQFSLQDVSKLKQLCTVTNEWIQQQSSELLDVLRRSDNKGGDNCHRTVTLQSRMSNVNFGHKPPNIFDRSYKDNDFQQNNNSSEAPNFDHLNKSHPANMHYEQNRERCNQQERNWGFEPTDMAKQNSYQSKSKSHLFSVIEKLKMYVNDKPFSVNNAARLFAEAVRATGTSYTLDYSQTDNDKQHRFNLVVENLILGIGKSFAKKKARQEAYSNALNRLKMSSIAELCDNGSSDKPKLMNKLFHQANIKHDDTRPVSTLVIIETQKTATRREKQAMSILRRSVYFSKMDMSKLISVVGNVHKVTVLVQNKPVGIGFGSSVTKASVNAAADALFNNFYRKNPVLLTLDEDDSKKWIYWTKIKYLAKEMQRIGGHSLIAGQDISNRSFATAIQKLVDTHPWNIVNNELIFSPGMPEDCVQILYSIARERNLSFEERRHRQLGTYYIIQRYYDPVDIVSCLEKNGGCKGKYRLIPKAEILQIQCDHWEPKSQVWKQKKVPKEVLESKRHRESRFPRMGESDRNFDNSSTSPVGRAFNNGTFSSMSNRQKMAISDDKEFAQMPNYKGKDVILHSKEKYFLPNNNDGRFDQKFTQDREICGFNDGEFRQMSRSDKEFRQMSDSYDREPKQMSWPNDKGSRQMPQPDDRGFGQVRQPDDRGFGQVRQPDDRGFGQIRQPDDREFGQMRQPDNREFGQNRQPDDREFGQMRKPDDRGFGQMRQPDSEEFGQVRWLDNREFGQMRQPDEVELGQVCLPDREFRKMSRPNYEESNQTTWHDRREFKQTFWPHDKDSNKMPGSNDREFRETSRLNSREFRRMHNFEAHEFNQIHGLMERGVSDNFDREFSHDKNKTLGHEDRRFNANYDYTGRDFNQISERNEREFNSQFRNERDRGHSYDENYKQVLDVNKERFSQNPYENKLDKLSGQSDIGLHHSSNYDRRINESFDFGKQVSDPDNRRYNQSLHQSKRDYDRVSCDDNRHHAQVANYDDRRLRFNNDQLTRMDHQNNQRNQDDLIDTKRMQSNATWNKMQDQRGDGRIVVSNSRMYPPNTQMPCGPPQENMMMQNMMNQAENNNQLTALRFLTKKIAHTALHANVKSILANARKLSNIAKARSRMEKSANSKVQLNVKKHGKGIETNKLQKRTVPGNQPKTAPSILRISQNSKVTKKPNGKQSALNKSTNRRVRSRGQNAKKMRQSHSSPKGGNTVKKIN